MKAHVSARRKNRKSTNSSLYLWLLPVLLVAACAIVLSAPAVAADGGARGASLDDGMALSAASTFAGGQGRAGATRGSSGGGATATRSGGSSSGGGATASRGTSGSAGRARPGGGGGGRTTVHRPPRTGGGGHFRGFYYPRHYPYFGFSFFRYPYYYGYYVPSYYHGYPRVLWYDYPANGSLGGLDLNIKPKKAEVYIDGQRIGRVGRFDGYPSVLWLEEGTYDLVVYHPEHQTLHQTVKVFAGLVIDIDERLVPGVPTPPEEIVPPPAPAPAYDEEERVATDRRAPPARELDLRHQPARLHLTIEPRDASVYLDGRFLGTGDELADLRSGLMVNAGEHQLSVVRPSYESEELTVDVAAGEDLELAIRLRRAGRVEEEPDAESDTGGP